MLLDNTRPIRHININFIPVFIINNDYLRQIKISQNPSRLRILTIN